MIAQVRVLFIGTEEGVVESVGVDSFLPLGSLLTLEPFVSVFVAIIVRELDFATRALISLDRTRRPHGRNFQYLNPLCHLGKD